MFDTLSDKLQRSLKVLRGQGKLTEKNVQDTLREVRLALRQGAVLSFPCY